MRRKSLHIVVMGEVDSGKSTLIGRFLFDCGCLNKEPLNELTHISQELGKDLEFAYLLDSFEEERKQEFTLDTTQVFCNFADNRNFVFIDVPGHYELIKNMLSGSSYADMGVLVVDAQKGLELQTKMHARILKFLGIERVILAVNKMDVINFSKINYEAVVSKIAGYLNSIGVELKYCIPICAKEGDNILSKSKRMPWYDGLSFIEVLNSSFGASISNHSNFCFSIQDVYKLKRQKIAVGSILSGKIAKDAFINLLPFNRRLKVKAIKVFGRDINSAAYPKSIGIVLNGTSLLKRGQILCSGKMPKVCKEFSAKLFCIKPIRESELLSFMCINQSVGARVNKITKVCDNLGVISDCDAVMLKPNEFAEVMISVARPVVIDEFNKHRSLGRFVLEKNNEICAIGIIT